MRGYDVFLNIVLEDAFEEKDGGEKVKIGTVVSIINLRLCSLLWSCLHPCTDCCLTVCRSFVETRSSCWKQWSG